MYNLMKVKSFAYVTQTRLYIIINFHTDTKSLDSNCIGDSNDINISCILSSKLPSRKKNQKNLMIKKSN